MSAGIYMYNGVLAYAMNLEKKLKRRKGAVIIEEYDGNDEKELQKLLDKHNNIIKNKEPEYSDSLIYHWINKETKHSHHSIRNKSMGNEWIPYIKNSDTSITFNINDIPWKTGDKILGKTIIDIKDLTYYLQ